MKEFSFEYLFGLFIKLFEFRFSDILNIELWIPQDTELEIKVFDQNGKRVISSLISQFKTKGKYNELLQTTDLSVGQYILQI